MQVITSLTQKGQVTLPKRMRDTLGMDPFDKVVVEKGKGFIKVSPTKDILNLAGTFFPKTKKPVLLARKAIEKSYKRT